MLTHIFKELVRRPIGLIILIVLGGLYGAAFFAPFLSPVLPSKQNLAKLYHPPTKLLWKEGRLHIQEYRIKEMLLLQYEAIPGKTVPVKFFAKGVPYKLFGFIPWDRHLFLPDTDDPEARIYLLGSDGVGLDMFTRLIYGAQISLSIGFIGITITMVLGFFVGGFSGYFGGTFDFISMRLVELLMVIPGLYLLLALRSTLAPFFSSDKMYVVIISVLALIGWSGTARVIRGMSSSIRTRAFVMASVCMGQSTIKILTKHILPNLISYLLVAATLSIPRYILGEASLSFLGLGIQEPSPSWGLMLKQAQQMKVFMLNFWWILTPGFLIFISVISFNILGDILRDIVDPRMKL